MLPLFTSCADKLKGGGELPPKSLLNPFVSGVYGFLTTGTLVLTETKSVFRVVAPSFAATIVLLYSAPSAPFSQPRNVILGHVVSATIGCSSNKVLTLIPQLANETTLKTSLSVGLSVSAMQALNVVHPPGAATAFLASSEDFLFIITPILVGSVTLCLLSIFLNNLSTSRRYPSYY